MSLIGEYLYERGKNRKDIEPLDAIQLDIYLAMKRWKEYGEMTEKEIGGGCLDEKH